MADYILATERDAYIKGNPDFRSSSYTATKLCTKARANLLGCCVNYRTDNSIGILYNLSTRDNGGANSSGGLIDASKIFSYTATQIVRKQDLMSDPGVVKGGYYIIGFPISGYKYYNQGTNQWQSISNSVLLTCASITGIYATHGSHTLPMTSAMSNPSNFTFLLTGSTLFLVWRLGITKDCGNNGLINLPISIGSSTTNTNCIVDFSNGKISMNSNTSQPIYISIHFLANNNVGYYFQNIALSSSSTYGSMQIWNSPVSPCYPYECTFTPTASYT